MAVVTAHSRKDRPMRAVARVLVALVVSVGLAVGPVSTTPSARADDTPPIFVWTTPNDFQMSCWSADDCAFKILHEINSYTRGTGECSTRQPGWQEYCLMMRGLTEELWQRIYTWEDAQAALAEYYMIWQHIANTEPGTGVEQVFGQFYSTALEYVEVMFDPVTHEYLGPPVYIPTPTPSPTPTPTPTPTTPTNPDPKPFIRTLAPTISGTAKVGKMLTANIKDWMPMATNRYQWLRNGEAVDGATTSKYTLTAADLGAVISVSVTGVRSGYIETTRTSTGTRTVVIGTLAKGKVKITGTKRVGKFLIAKVSKWSSGAEYHYQWYRGSKKIAGATDRSYELTAADKGKKIKVKVWTTKDGHKPSATKTSKKTSKVKTGHLTKVTPVIGGDPIVGETLMANPGSWTYQTIFSYQWYRNGKKVRGATQASYTLTVSDVGKTLKVKVTGKLKGYTTTSKYSKSTVKVTVPVPTPPPAPPEPSPEPTPTTP